MKKISRILLALLLLLPSLPNLSFAAQDPTFDSDLEVYLEEISATRGFEVTKEDIEESLTLYELGLDDFDSVTDLSDFLGEVISSDNSNLEDMLTEYDLTIDELNSLLEENGEAIDDYVFIDDLDYSVSFYLNPIEGDPGSIDDEFATNLLAAFQEQFGLTEAELNKLSEHFIAHQEELSSPESLAKLEELATRMEAFGEFDKLTDLNSEQVQEFLSIYDEFLTILQLKVDFYLVKSDKESAIPFWEVLSMNELNNAKLKMNIYDLSGNFLADLLITGEMVDSDTVNEVGQEVDKATEKVVVEKAKTETTAVQFKTEKGGKLPNTAGNYVPNILIGLFMILSGVMVYRTYRRIL
ncbi:processed acidic surface protein [Bacillus sp. 1NLA3E]|uniref:processed acidic surface protein n=1 Tax=Bacillus sp. 1NLA3E TaxID=666686 RepID=UPI000247EA93|nr:processed acidic surface protein [Bacillus sp. 1NLA3E]AGK55804.1 LPXTG-motif cell wall anchor domain-containing protein [Bacillus sp. 1NLA3E]